MPALTRPKPIRLDPGTWLVIRDGPDMPTVVLERRRNGRREDVFSVAKWALDPAERMLMGTTPTPERADMMVRWDLPLKRDGRGGHRTGSTATGHSGGGDGCG